MLRKRYVVVLILAMLTISAAAQEKELTAESKAGAILLTSSDKGHQVSLDGRIYMDGVHYFDDKTNLSSGASINDIRFGTTMKWGDWTAKVNVSFGNNQVGIRDAFLKYNQSDNRFFIVGNYLEPFGIEASNSSKDLRFIDPAHTSQAMGIGHSIGFGYTYYTDKFFGSTGIFAGAVNNQNKGDQGFATTTKLAYTAIANDKLVFQLGSSFTFRTPESDLSEYVDDDDYKREVALTAGPENRFLNANIKGAKTDLRYNFQSLLLCGAVMLQSEYTRTEVTRYDEYVSGLIEKNPYLNSDYSDWYNDIRDVETDAFYITAGFLLGDDYSYNSSKAYMNRPQANSYEFLMRYDNTNLNDNSFYDGDSLNKSDNLSVQGGRVKTISAAVNYYLNNNIMFRLNYSYMAIQNQNYPLDEKIGVFRARVQVSF